VTEEIKVAARLSNEPQLGMKILDLVDIRITSLYQAMQKALHGLLQEKIQLPQQVSFAHVPDAIDYDLYRQCLRVTPEFNARQTCNHTSETITTCRHRQETDTTLFCYVTWSS
jgi:hypothetical protein